MKKDRNSFFSGYGYGNNIPVNGMNMIPNQQVASTSTFYQGPVQDNMNNNMYSDIDSRLSKIERRLSRLENRVTHLEGDTNSIEDNYSNNMYMV